MRRGTTPTLELAVTGIETLSADSLYITIRQGCTLITKRETDATIDGSTISLYLSQSETLALSQGKAEIQIRGINSAGSAWASNIATISVKEILKDGVITYDQIDS